MIKFNPRPIAPTSLSAEKVENTKNLIAQKVKSGQKPSTSNPNDFPSHWIPDARRELWKHQNYRCCYCERSRGLKRESDLEHFRPKAKVEEEPDHYGYWWLAYVWENYLYSCKPCNEDYKKNKFPLLPSSQRAFEEKYSLDKEKPILINPFDEDPEVFIRFDWQDSNNLFVKAVQTEKDVEDRGKKTIEITGINEDRLPEERAGDLLTLEGIAKTMHAAVYMKDLGMDSSGLLEKTEKEIKLQTSSKSEKSFIGFRRAYFRKVGLGPYIAND